MEEGRRKVQFQSKLPVALCSLKHRSSEGVDVARRQQAGPKPDAAKDQANHPFRLVLPRTARFPAAMCVRGFFRKTKKEGEKGKEQGLLC